MTPTLVYIYGPPAAGKLTIGARLAELTGFRLFHNHLTVGAITPVFEFNSPPFLEVIHRLRLDVFATSMRSGTSVIFTNSSAWSGVDGRQRFEAFADEARRTVEDAGGATAFVRVTAPRETLADRVGNASRHPHGKLIDPGRLHEILDGHDGSSLHTDDLVLDSSELTPDEAAERIAAALGSQVGSTPGYG